MKYLLFFLPLYLFATTPHDAIRSFNTTALTQTLTSENRDTFENQETALMLAVQMKQLKSVETLLEMGANVDLGNPTPIYTALVNNYTDIAARLLDKGAKLPESLGISNRGLLYDLLLQRKYESVGFLLDRGVGIEKNARLNAFSLALSFAPFSLIETFVAHGVNVNYPDPLLDRPVEIALRLERHNVLQLLVDKGANISDAGLLKIAVAHDDVKSLAILVKAGCAIDSKHQNLAMLGVKFNSVDMTQLLIQAGVSINYSYKDETLFSLAIKHKSMEIVNWLLDQELNPSVHSKALFDAIDYGKLPLVKLLVERKIGLNSKKSGLTPLLYTFKVKQFEVASYLISIDANLQAKDSQGENALFKSIRFFEDALVSDLLAKGFDVNSKNRRGLSALNFSIMIGNFKAFTLLLDKGALKDNLSLTMSVKKGLERFYIHLQSPSDTVIVDDKKNSFLHMAAALERTSMLKRLLLEGMDVHSINNRGETALHVAAKKGLKPSVALLLNFDANVTALDARGFNPQNLAFKYNHPKLGKWLEDYQAKKMALLLEAQQPLGESNVTTIPSL